MMVGLGDKAGNGEMEIATRERNKEPQEEWHFEISERCPSSFDTHICGEIDAIQKDIKFYATQLMEGLEGIRNR